MSAADAYPTSELARITQQFAERLQTAETLTHLSGQHNFHLPPYAVFFVPQTLCFRCDSEYNLILLWFMEHREALEYAELKVRQNPALRGLVVSLGDSAVDHIEARPYARKAAILEREAPAGTGS